jgi:hypothetical protein
VIERRQAPGEHDRLWKSGTITSVRRRMPLVLAATQVRLSIAS